MFVNMTIYMCCLFTIYIIYMWILYYTYIYVCVDARYNYILCIVMYILIQIVIEYDSTKLFFRECAFQPFLVLAQHHHFEQFFCWTCCCPYYLHIYIYIVVLALKPSRNEFEPSPSDRPYISNQIQNTQPPLQRLKNISSFWDVPRIGSGCWPLSLWTRIKLLQINYNMAMAQTHVPFVVHI